jgi:hypothetical protein
VNVRYGNTLKYIMIPCMVLFMILVYKIGMYWFTPIKEKNYLQSSLLEHTCRNHSSLGAQFLCPQQSLERERERERNSMSRVNRVDHKYFKYLEVADQVEHFQGHQLEKALCGDSSELQSLWTWECQPPQDAGMPVITNDNNLKVIIKTKILRTIISRKLRLSCISWTHAGMRHIIRLTSFIALFKAIVIQWLVHHHLHYSKIATIHRTNVL